MKQIAYLKPDAEHLNVRAEPNGKVIGSVSSGVMVQLTGAPDRETATVTWVEGFYEGNGKIVRGWMAKKWLDIKPDPVFYNPSQFNPPPLDYDPLNAPLGEIPTIVDPNQKFRDDWIDMAIAISVPAFFIGLCALALYIVYTVFSVIW